VPSTAAGAEDAKWLKELESENGPLKLLAEARMDIEALKVGFVV